MDRASAESTTRAALIAGLAGLVAVGSLAVTARTYRLSLQGQLTDRYTKAVEQRVATNSTSAWAASTP